MKYMKPEMTSISSFTIPVGGHPAVKQPFGCL